MAFGCVGIHSGLQVGQKIIPGNNHSRGQCFGSVEKTIRAEGETRQGDGDDEVGKQAEARSCEAARHGDEYVLEKAYWGA